MTNDGNTVPREESEPLHQVLSRARRGESITRGMGPFFLVANLSDGGTEPIPRPFDSVEEAVLFLVDGFPLLDLFLSDATSYTVAVKAHPTVQ